LIKSLHKCSGAPIGIPKALASFDLAMIHPSLFDKTTTGLLLISGLKTLSQDT
jgi:hypothetical protein